MLMIKRKVVEKELLVQLACNFKRQYETWIKIESCIGTARRGFEKKSKAGRNIQSWKKFTQDRFQVDLDTQKRADRNSFDVELGRKLKECSEIEQRNKSFALEDMERSTRI